VSCRTLSSKELGKQIPVRSPTVARCSSVNFYVSRVTGSNECLSMCPSVCLSVVCQYYVKAAKDVNICLLLGSHTIPVFPYQKLLRYSDGE